MNYISQWKDIETIGRVYFCFYFIFFTVEFKNKELYCINMNTCQSLLYRAINTFLGRSKRHESGGIVPHSKSEACIVGPAKHALEYNICVFKKLYWQKIQEQLQYIGLYTA